MEEPPRHTLQSLHDRSWEMELLLSGFVLVLLLPLPTYVEEKGLFLLFDVEYGIVQQFLIISYVVGVFGSRILIVNLIAYLFLRGFWIGMVGLAATFPKGVNLDQLHYHERFRQYLTTRVAPAEGMIRNLDRGCSLVFSFSFLAIFLIFAFFILLFVFVGINLALQQAIFQFPEDYWLAQSLDKLQTVAAIVIAVLGGLVLVDLFSGGLLKRIKQQWFVRLYFPLYRFFRVVTLAPIYDPIYYTLVSNISRRSIGLFLLAYFAALYFFVNYAYDDVVFFPDEPSRYQIDHRHYEEYYAGATPISRPMIAAEYTDKSYIRLFLPYLVDDNDSLAARCPEAQRLRDEGMQQAFGFSIDFEQEQEPAGEGKDGTARSNDNDVTAVLQCLSSLYRIAIDDKPRRETTFYFHRRADTNQAGIVTYLPIDKLPPGPHLLTVEKKSATAGGKEASQQSAIRGLSDVSNIPFVKQ